MADVARLLESLHPMREPPPPAPVGPYLAMTALGLGLAVIVFAGWLLWRRHPVGLGRAAERDLRASRDLPGGERLAAQAAILRRIVRASSGATAARESGPGWLARLDRTFATDFFSTGDGRAYGDDLYRRAGAASGAGRPDVEGLDAALVALLPRLDRRAADHGSQGAAEAAA